MKYSAWDGYIEGTTIEIGPDRIVQLWRTTEFAADDPMSRLELVFEPDDDGTLLTLRHSEIPHGQGDQYRQGWHDHYFTHMQESFRG